MRLDGVSGYWMMLVVRFQGIKSSGAAVLCCKSITQKSKRKKAVHAQKDVRVHRNIGRTCPEHSRISRNQPPPITTKTTTSGEVE
eukprot:1388034-Amorphochlora_amoeboformis.AAC.1